jgi:hypothetical protein
MELFGYRARLVNPGFEPFGIALPVTQAERAGLRPVIYGSAVDYAGLSDSDKPFFQSAGHDGLWRHEREWRFRGDFDLTAPAPGLTLIVPDANEARVIGKETDLPVIAAFLD